MIFHDFFDDQAQEVVNGASFEWLEHHGTVGIYRKSQLWVSVSGMASGLVGTPGRCGHSCLVVSCALTSANILSKSNIPTSVC